MIIRFAHLKASWLWLLYGFETYRKKKPIEETVLKGYLIKKGGWGGMLITNITACQKEIVLFSLYEKVKSPYTAVWKFKNK